MISSLEEITKIFPSKWYKDGNYFWAKMLVRPGPGIPEYWARIGYYINQSDVPCYFFTS